MNKYLIALEVGGLMEMPDVTYENFDVIVEESREEAVEIYNEKHNCHYFYGVCLAEKVDGVVIVLNEKVNIEKLELLNT